ncbi:MAG: hypothetical protein QW699_05620 [Metallosphaera sp.]
MRSLGIIINLFLLKPSENTVKVYYIPKSNKAEINLLGNELTRKYDCLTGLQYSSYLGLEPGVYFICDDSRYEGLRRSNLFPQEKFVGSTSYVMKYLLLKALAMKVHNSFIQGNMFLPRGWNSYSQISCCESKSYVESSPHTLFRLMKCLTLRVEHLISNGSDRLYLLANFRVRRLGNLSLNKVINILREKGYEDDMIKGFLSDHFYRCFTENYEGFCVLQSIDFVRGVVNVLLDDIVLELPLESVNLNPHPKNTREFIVDILGENLDYIYGIQRASSDLRPKERMLELIELLESLLIKTKVFPINIGGVSYMFSKEPTKIVQSIGSGETT